MSIFISIYQIWYSFKSSKPIHQCTFTVLRCAVVHAKTKARVNTAKQSSFLWSKWSVPTKGGRRHQSFWSQKRCGSSSHILPYSNVPCISSSHCSSRTVRHGHIPYSNVPCISLDTFNTPQIWSPMTESTDNAPPPRNTESRNSNSSVQFRIKPKPQFECVPRDNERSQFLDLVVKFAEEVFISSPPIQYGVATISRLLKNYRSFLQQSPIKETTFCKRDL